MLPYNKLVFFFILSWNFILYQRFYWQFIFSFYKYERPFHCKIKRVDTMNTIYMGPMVFSLFFILIFYSLTTTGNCFWRFYRKCSVVVLYRYLKLLSSLSTIGLRHDIFSVQMVFEVLFLIRGSVINRHLSKGPHYRNLGFLPSIDLVFQHITTYI